MRRLIVLAVGGALAVTGALPAPAGAARTRACGKVTATLKLDDKDPQAVAETTFGRSKDPQQLTLIYDVTGCRPAEGLPAPADPLRVGPVKGSPAFPYGAVRLDGPPEIDGRRYTLRLKVYTDDEQAAAATAAPPSAAEQRSGTVNAASANAASSGPDFTLDPGTYTAFVLVSAPWMHTAATPITISRSENNRLIPLLCGFIGAALGFGAFWFLRLLHEDRLKVHGWVLLLAGLSSIAVGTGTAYFTNYLNQDVWTMDTNGLAAGTAAFTASTTGWAAGLLAGIWTDGNAGTVKMPKLRRRRRSEGDR